MSGWVVFRALQEIEADAVVLAVGISGLQKIVSSSAALAARAEFRAVANLGSLDVLAGLLGSSLSDVSNYNIRGHSNFPWLRVP